MPTAEITLSCIAARSQWACTIKRKGALRFLVHKTARNPEVAVLSVLNWLKDRGYVKDKQDS